MLRAASWDDRGDRDRQARPTTLLGQRLDDGPLPGHTAGQDWGWSRHNGRLQRREALLTFCSRHFKILRD